MGAVVATSDGIAISGPLAPIAIGVFVALVTAVILYIKGRDTRPAFRQLPGQAATLELIWHGIFGVPRFSWLNPWTYRNRAPAVEWVTGSGLDHEGRAFTYTWGNPPRSIHLAGQSFDLGLIKVALPAGKAAKDTALIHELYHQYRLYRTGGDGDGQHLDPGWYEMSGKVALASAALAKSELGTHVE